MEKEINSMLEECVAAICRGIAGFIKGVFAGIKKLRYKKTLIAFFISLLVSGLTYCVLKDRIFALSQLPRYVRYILYYFLLAAPICCLYIAGSVQPQKKKDFDDAFAEIDFRGRDGKYPYLCAVETDGKKLIYIFKSNIPLDEWRSRKSLLETAFDCTILRMESGKSKKVVQVTTLPSDYRIPDKVLWSDDYLKTDSGVITVGVGALEDIVFDLNRVPHVLAAGETGSGKSVILRTILWQLINQGSRVYMLDFKGGVEFGLDYENYGEVVTERKRALQILTKLLEENEQRLALFRRMRVKNIVEYNRKTGKNLCRIGVICDEVAEMLDKKGASKEDKDLMTQIEGKISSLARLSRATGINLILGMQRPDANVLTGQIKNNIPIRIAGRFADKTASEIVLGNTDACHIPDIKGRFMYKVGNETQEFQAYYFDDDVHLKDVDVEVGDMLIDALADGSTKRDPKRQKNAEALVEQQQPKQQKQERQQKKVQAEAEKEAQEKILEEMEEEATQEKILKVFDNPYEGMSQEELEAEKEKLDNYDLNLDFFG